MQRALTASRSRGIVGRDDVAVPGDAVLQPRRRSEQCFGSGIVSRIIAARATTTGAAHFVVALGRGGHGLSSFGGGSSGGLSLSSPFTFVRQASSSCFLVRPLTPVR